MLSVLILLFFKNPSIGDNMLTAISVARDCGMVQTHERVIIVDAVPPRDFQPASITWRYTENPRDVADQVRFMAGSMQSARSRGLTVRTSEELVRCTD